MKILVAKLLKLLFKIPAIEKRYYGIIKKINRTSFFEDITVCGIYDENIQIVLCLSDWLQQQIYFRGIYEASETAFFIKNIKPDTIFYDIGANIGYYTLLAAKRIGSFGKVYAFEPDANNRKLLEENIRLNGFTNVKIVPKAVAENNNKVINLYISDGSNRGMTSTEKPENFSGKIEQIKTVSIDEFMKNTPLPTLIKVDAEGSEYSVLQGMIKLSALKSTQILIEINKETLENHGLSVEKVSNFIKNTMKYNVYDILKNGEIRPTTSLKESSLTLLKV